MRKSFTAGVATCLTALLLALSACSGPLGADTDLADTEPPYVSPYDRAGLLRENGRFTYSENGTVLSRMGIDVSSHQGVIDWQTVAGDGIEFAFLRLGYRGATEGTINIDEYFETNFKGATDAGIPVGTYFFSQALDETEARAEAEYVLNVLQGRTLDYPVVYDFEPVFLDTGAGRANAISDFQRTRNAVAFCELIEAAGYATMIYGNKEDIASYYLDTLGGRDIWFAEYDVDFPSGRFDFTIWQYTSSGRVAGIDTRVDMNIELIHKG
ncbi:MAG TPA: glycoside hydrolase [Coriobacteriia bacterium]|nr:glycoside hydrolase [Coriobacteriia bacterium]